MGFKANRGYVGHSMSMRPARAYERCGRIEGERPRTAVPSR